MSAPLRGNRHLADTAGRDLSARSAKRHRDGVD